MTDYDSPWKQVRAAGFPVFLEFFFSAAYAGIDWMQGYTLLDKELRKVVRDVTFGQRRADQLVCVTGRDGIEDWVLAHVECRARVNQISRNECLSTTTVCTICMVGWW